MSSGTWSLLGIELDAPVLTPKALQLNFSNEGGVGRTTRLLKNVMGLWMLQGCRRSWAEMGHRLSYGDIMEAAGREPGFHHLVDPDEADRSSVPITCPRRSIASAREPDKPSPTTPGRYARAVLDSLALKYRLVLKNLEIVTGRRIEQIRIIGGGSKNRLLNQFTADATGVRVLAGPAEATALGNIAVQMLATGAVSSLADARAIIDRSFPTEMFEPQDPEPWEREAQRFQQYCEWTYA